MNKKYIAWSRYYRFWIFENYGAIPFLHETLKLYTTKLHENYWFNWYVKICFFQYFNMKCYEEYFNFKILSANILLYTTVHVVVLTRALINQTKQTFAYYACLSSLYWLVNGTGNTASCNSFQMNKLIDKLLYWCIIDI